MTEREELIRDIQSYVPFNEQEEKDKEIILKHLLSDNDIFLRENKTAHMTASCWIIDESKEHVLLCYHRIYQSWSWLGGHADGEENLLSVALKEAKEESSLKNLKPYDGKILSLEILTVDGHEKRGEYVSSHLHLNVTYLLIGESNEIPQAKEDENAGVRWFLTEDALKASTEPWFVKRIYSKLVEKVKRLTF